MIPHEQGQFTLRGNHTRDFISLTQSREVDFVILQFTDEDTENYNWEGNTNRVKEFSKY